MRYHNITKDDMLNGDGLRVVLWVSGCSHSCKECHNPVTWDPEAGLLFDAAARHEIFEQLNQDYISGITFSGGDPLHPANRPHIQNLMREIKERYPCKTIWLYTGESWENMLEEYDKEKHSHQNTDKHSEYSILDYVNVVVDGKFVAEEKDNRLLWKGSKNQRVIDVKKSLEQSEPMVPILHTPSYEENDED